MHIKNLEKVRSLYREYESLQLSLSCIDIQKEAVITANSKLEDPMCHPKICSDEATTSALADFEYFNKKRNEIAAQLIELGVEIND